MTQIIRNLALFSFAISLATGCSTLFDRHVEWEVVEPDHYPTLSAVGYAPIAPQQGETESVKTLMAMKASKLDAYRELAEQVYGQRIDGKETLANMVINDSSLRSSVEGVIRGARVIKAYPVGEDTYATELELDMQKVYEIYLTTTKPKRVRKVTYY